MRENGNHSDCLQSVWGGDGLYFRRNYLHDNRCQGFFIKDQPAPVAHVVLEDNLMLRNEAPCEPAGSDCGPPEIVQIVGPTRGLALRSNTIWTPGNDTPVGLREGPFGRISVTDNVIFRAWSDWPGPFTNFVQRGNLVCQWEGTLPPLQRSSSTKLQTQLPRPRHRRLPPGQRHRGRLGAAGPALRPLGHSHFFNRSRRAKQVLDRFAR